MAVNSRVGRQNIRLTHPFFVSFTPFLITMASVNHEEHKGGTSVYEVSPDEKIPVPWFSLLYAAHGRHFGVERFGPR
jgi:hypothetical protein